VPPDLDKLIRSTCDGITRGKLWVDDARVVRIEAEKQHAATPQETGVHIFVKRWSP
jgi:Holliday junction resolvase RusA-like endonuclease